MTRITFNRACAVAMLAAGTGMAAAGFVVPPTGEIAPSVLMFTAQAFIFAGSAMGIDVMMESKLMKLNDGKNKEGGK